MPAERGQAGTPPERVLELYERFVELLRAGDVETARELAPGVVILDADEPYNETGPLHPAAFAPDDASHRILSWDEIGPDQFRLRSGASYLRVERRNADYVIAEGGLKPIE